MELFTTLLVERNTCLTQESNRYATIVKYFNMLKFEKKWLKYTWEEFLHCNYNYIVYHYRSCQQTPMAKNKTKTPKKKKPHQKTKQNPKHHTNNKQNNKQTNSSITLIKFPGMYYKINRRTSSPLEYNYVRMYAIIHADLHLINILNRSNTSLWYISYLLSSLCKSNRLCLMTLKHG